ncbi:hypothetical protein POL68_28350 [Stigmatella sp. ncwal1]|uniref:DUF6748 domain-containing protein n=1 Tax=Stigmatella ashevillensis TaxID=2995309 RepID=A0ABT5DH24_9BACT|nr:DUF6748 domain-containing protein [Stigmatella ashevillena]MDC0712408.1 hypothetical protein [Stigmatella ashevillena]
MSTSPLLLSALCLGLVTGCARSASPESSPMTPSPKSSAPSESASEDSAGTAQDKPQTYLVRDSGIRCFAPPCPSFLAVPAGKSDKEGIQIHEVDFSAVVATQEKKDDLMSAAGSKSGLKVEAVISRLKNAGPGGDASVLNVRRVFE